MQLINTSLLRGTSSLNPKSLAQVLDQWFSTFAEAGPTFVFKNILGPTRTTTCQSICFFSVTTLLTIMGVGRIFFQRRASRGFFQNFSRGAKSGKIFFSNSKLGKQPFFAGILKIQGPAYPVPLTDARRPCLLCDMN